MLQSEREGDRDSCPGCSTPLVVPYVRCAQCTEPRVNVCLHCFARGLEFGRHESNHRYYVIKNDFSMYCPDWTAAEELKLLDALSECGFGNWTDVAQHMQTKAKSSCEAHYMKHYMESPAPPLPATDEPPRPSEGTPLQAELSGYMPARGDFGVEYDNYAEMDLRDISFVDKDEGLYRDLKLMAVEVYRNVLLERYRRRRTIKRCGLINIKKNMVHNRRYERTISTSYMDGLRVFQRVLSPADWDIFLESWHYEMQLRQTIKRLQGYREAGLRTLASAKVYDRLRARRDEQPGGIHLLDSVLGHLEAVVQTRSNHQSCAVKEKATHSHSWIKKQTALSKVCRGETSLPGLARRTMVPLEIECMPGYEKLTDKEREMCSVVRLVPESYLDFKELLMAECRKIGFLRLAQARTLIKIDVNKTRKIYDFLLEEGHIYKDPIVK